MKAKLLSFSRLQAKLRNQSIQQGQRLAANDSADITLYEKFPINYHNKLTNIIVMMMIVITVVNFGKQIKFAMLLFKLKLFQVCINRK